MERKVLGEWCKECNNPDKSDYYCTYCRQNTHTEEPYHFKSVRTGKIHEDAVSRGLIIQTKEG